MRNRFQNMMSGRNGSDQLNNFILIVALILVFLNLFVRVSWLWVIGVVLLVIAYIRIFSRNTVRRSMENDRFLSIVSRFRRGGFGRGRNSGGYDSGYGSSGSSYSRQENAERKKAQRQDRRCYSYFNCPNCNQKVRVPKGKGKIEITCPKCRTSFIRKT